MRGWRAGAVLLAAAWSGACAPRPDPAAARAALMDADRAFAAETARRGADGWAAFFEAGGQQFQQRGVIVGAAAIRAVMARAFADTTRRLQWHPVQAVLAASGDLGYTIGRWDAQVRGAGGAWAPEGTGNYVTIWRRQGDGSWKVAVDIGNEDPPGTPSSRP
jgi:ketosteroid isomerase-like protein